MNFKKAASTLFLGLFCAAPAGAAGWGEQDFRVLPSNSPLFRNTSRIFSESTNCRDHIAEVMCLVNPQPDGQTGPRECIHEDLSESVVALQKVHDAFPKALSKIFCTLDTIYVERDFIGTAYAASDPQTHKAVMGIRESALRGNFSLEKWINWKEQLSFGGSKQGYESRDDLVRVQAHVKIPGGASDFLYFVIAHEFGHIYDFANGVNAFPCADPLSSAPCPAKAGTWSAWSWESLLPKYEDTEADPWGLLAYLPNASGAFAHRDELCFYGCQASHGTPGLMRSLYDSIDQSNLLTTEATAFWASTSRFETVYKISLPDGAAYDLAQKFRVRPNYAPKREWLEKFYAPFNE